MPRHGIPQAPKAAVSDGRCIGPSRSASLRAMQMSGRRTQYERRVAIGVGLDDALGVPENGNLFPARTFSPLELKSAAVDRYPGDVVSLGRIAAPPLSIPETDMKAVEIR